MIENITNNLTANYKKSAKRPGRGISAGQGKTAGRGTKGQKSRAGHNIPNRFEGGQTVLAMRLPKIRGFKSHSEKAIVITLDDISQNFKNGETVSSQSLKEKGLIKHESQKVKILNNGTLSIKVKIEDIQISKSVSELLQHSDKPEKKEKQIIE